MARDPINIEAVRGDYWEITLEVTERTTGEPADFTGAASALCHVRSTRDGAVVVSFDSAAGEIDYSTVGYIILTKAATATDIAGGTYQYDIEFNMGTATAPKPKTPIVGNFRIEDDITY